MLSLLDVTSGCGQLQQRHETYVIIPDTAEHTCHCYRSAYLLSACSQPHVMSCCDLNIQILNIRCWIVAAWLVQWTRCNGHQSTKIAIMMMKLPISVCWKTLKTSLVYHMKPRTKIDEESSIGVRTDLRGTAQIGLSRPTF